jgi:hypothetical protein
MLFKFNPKEILLSKRKMPVFGIDLKSNQQVTAPQITLIHPAQNFYGSVGVSFTQILGG